MGLQLLTSRQTELEQNVSNDQAQLAKLTQELGVSSVSSEMVNPYDKMVAESNAAVAHARREVLLAQAHLDAVKSHRARIKDADVEAKAQEMAASGSESTTARQKLIDTREQALVELAGLGPNHPGRPALQADYEGEAFKVFRAGLGDYGMERPERLGSPYFAPAEPQELLYDEIEAIWAAIAEGDDWAPFEAKLAAIEAARQGWALG